MAGQVGGGGGELVSGWMDELSITGKCISEGTTKLKSDSGSPGFCC